MKKLNIEDLTCVNGGEFTLKTIPLVVSMGTAIFATSAVADWMLSSLKSEGLRKDLLDAVEQAAFSFMKALYKNLK